MSEPNAEYERVLIEELGTLGQADFDEAHGIDQMWLAGEDKTDAAPIDGSEA